MKKQEEKNIEWEADSKITMTIKSPMTKRDIALIGIFIVTVAVIVVGLRFLV